MGNYSNPPGELACFGILSPPAADYGFLKAELLRRQTNNIFAEVAAALETSTLKPSARTRILEMLERYRRTETPDATPPQVRERG